MFTKNTLNVHALMSVINKWYLIMLLSTKISAYSGSFLFK